VCIVTKTNLFSLGELRLRERILKEILSLGESERNFQLELNYIEIYEIERWVELGIDKVNITKGIAPP
jgi:hypothetical protein